MEVIVVNKECVIKIFFFISQHKHILWVLKRTVSMRRFFEHPKLMLKLMDKKISQFYAKKLITRAYLITLNKSLFR